MLEFSFLNNEIELPIKAKNINLEKLNQEIIFQPENDHRIDNSLSCCFFGLIKPKNSLKGVRHVFLYCHKYCGILNPKESEFEVLSNSVQVSVRGRFIYLTERNHTRQFSIKSDLSSFDKLVFNGSNDSVSQFFLSSLSSSSYFPPISHLTMGFYNEVLYNCRFLELFSSFSKEGFSDMFFESYIYAIDPFLPEVLSNLFDKYFDSIDIIESSFDSSIFVFRLLRSVFGVDESFSLFLQNLMKTSKDLINFFVLLLGSNIINDRTRMCLHLFYNVLSSSFGSSDLGKRYCSRFFIDCVCEGMSKNGFDNRSDILKIFREFKEDNHSKNVFHQYEVFINSFTKQPTGYCPSKKGTRSFDGFLVLIEFCHEHLSDFIDISLRQNVLLF